MCSVYSQQQRPDFHCPIVCLPLSLSLHFRLQYACEKDTDTLRHSCQAVGCRAMYVRGFLRANSRPCFREQGDSVDEGPALV